MSMSSRLRAEDWRPVDPTRIRTRPAREPRDERVRIPKPASRLRPAPLNVKSQATTAPQAPPALQKDTPDHSVSPLEPEIVDLATPSTWPRRKAQLQQAPSSGKDTPSLASRCSTRQSELSFGILDYYTRDHTPLQSPELPPPPTLPTPEVNPDIDQFDFGLSPYTSPSQTAQTPPSSKSASDARAGAEIGQPLIPISPVSPPDTKPVPTHPQQKNTYRLFPPINGTPTLSGALSKTLPVTGPMSTITSVPSHQQPDSCYRPRKESLSSSIRSRKDSFTSFRSNCRIPLRILSSSSDGTAHTRSTISSSPASPPEPSRWSDETITSPTAINTPGVRTSSGSLLGRDSVHYPACFFEDYDEEAPLRRKFGWRSVSLTNEQQARRGRFCEKKTTLGHCIRKMILCGACYGRSCC